MRRFRNVICIILKNCLVNFIIRVEALWKGIIRGARAILFEEYKKKIYMRVSIIAR